ncbi:UNVERIFIED_ORG: GcrA cell cycle regulator [Rhizobium etli]
MNNKKPVWTEERIALAEKMWKDGQSATLIAAKVQGVSRNSVLGIMNRERARFPLRGKGKGATEAKPRAAREKVVREQKPAKPQVSKPKVPARLASFGLIAYAPKPTSSTPFPHRGAVLEGGAPAGVPFIDLTSRQCAWPLTDFRDADGPDMPCCGLPRRGEDTPDSAYCPGHAAISRGEGR